MKSDSMRKVIPVTNYLTDEVHYDTLHAEADRNLSCSKKYCLGSHISQFQNGPQVTAGDSCSLDIFDKAEKYLKLYYKDHNRSAEFPARWKSVLDQLRTTGTYELSFEELEYGIRMAWRNAPRCAARLVWKNLQLLDKRTGIESADDMASAIFEHIRLGTNGGSIQPTMTVFRQRLYGEGDLRVWNGLGIAYAGYETEEGGKVGDQGNKDFTRFCERLGWKGKGGPFDVLPLVVSYRDGQPKFYDIPEDIIQTIPITHPTIDAIGDLKLQWFSLPMVAGQMLEVGGLQFPAAPFNGWYTSPEIATRDLLEPNRYDLLEPIGRALGLDTTMNTNLWKDRVALEMNTAVLHSFATHRATIVDQHTVSEQFQTFLNDEFRSRGGCPADWLWLTPAQSGSITSLWHQEMLFYHLSPSMERQDNLWQKYRFPEDGPNRTFRLSSIAKTVFFVVSLLKEQIAKRPKVSIVFATETGQSKTYANRLRKMLDGGFNVVVNDMEQFEEAVKPNICLFVASTFGSGDPPNMGQRFAAHLDKLLADRVARDEKKSKDMNWRSRSIRRRLSRRKSSQVEEEPEETFAHLKYSVFALGSSAYPDFCGFGRFLDSALRQLDAHRLVEVGLGDELGDREDTFQRWARDVIREICVETGRKEPQEGEKEVSQVRMKTVQGDPKTLEQRLSEQHGQNIESAAFHGVKVLSEDPKMILVTLGVNTKYEPGSHIIVFPNNDEEEVDFLLSKLTGAPGDNDCVSLQERTGPQKAWLTRPEVPVCTLRQLLLHHIDIRYTPSQQLIGLLVTSAMDPTDRDRLDHLATDFDSYDAWRKADHGIVDLFRQHPSLSVDAALLVSRLPSLRPRFYSVASAWSEKPNTVDLLLNVVEYQSSDGTQRKGLCSTHLLSSPPSVPVYFRGLPKPILPADPSTPLILIAIGSGLAPFRGFWQERALLKRRGRALGPCYLFYGCRNRGTDVLKEETDALGDDVIKRFSAYSRGKDRKYVQTLVREHGRLVTYLMRQKSARLYMCGKISMASQVEETLVDVIAQHGQVTEEEAQEVIANMRNEDRYWQDIFGEH